MTFVGLLAAVAFGILFIRAIAWRTTLTLRTLATFTILGAAYAVFWNPLVTRLVDPYFENGPAVTFFLSLSLQLLLLIPVLTHFFRRRLFAAASVADAWLLGFSVGFGHDLAAAALMATRDWTGSDAAAAFGFLPPLSIVSKTMSSAGYAYWGALVCVLVAAALRFTRSRPVAWIVGVVATLFVAADAPLWFGPPPSLLQKAVATITLQGALTAWLSLVALVLFSVLEGRWVKKRAGAAGDVSVTAKSLWDSLKFGKLGKASRQLRILELARQLRIATAEAQLGENPRAVSAVHTLGPALAQAAARIDQPRPPVAFWKRQGLWVLLQWALLPALLFLPAIASYAWDPRFTFTFSALFNLSILNVVLAAVVGYRYLTAGIHAFRGNSNDLLQYGAENGLLRASLWASLLAAMLVNWTGYYGFLNLFSFGSGTALPDLTAQQLSTFALAFALGMTALTRRRAIRSRGMPIDQRRASAVWRFMTALSCFLIFTVSLETYLARLEDFHQQFGTRVYALSVQLGTNGNKLANFGFIIENTLRLLPLILLLVFLTRRITKWFQGGAPPSIAERVATTAAALLVAVWVGGGHVFAGDCSSANNCICIPPGANDGGGGVPPAITTVSFGSDRADNEAVIFGDNPQSGGDAPSSDTSTDGQEHQTTDASPPPAKPPDIMNQPLGGDDLF